MAIALALAASAFWGCSDFLAGLASRRLPVSWVLLLVEISGLLVLGVVAVIVRPSFFGHADDALMAAGAGIAGMLGLACFYRALAIGTMSVVAPISAASVALPVVLGVATGNRLSTVVAVGLVLIVIGVVLVSREQHEDEDAAATGRTSIGLALLSAIGFGSWFVLTDAAADASVLWTLLLARLAPLPIVAVAAVRVPRRPRRSPRFYAGVASVGLVDLTATALLTVANTKGALSIVAVLGNMYPLVTVLLAAAVLHERVRSSQLAGVVLALAGVAAVAAG